MPQNTTHNQYSIVDSDTLDNVHLYLKKQNRNTKHLTTQRIANSTIGGYVDPCNVIDASEQTIEH